MVETFKPFMDFFNAKLTKASWDRFKGLSLQGVKLLSPTVADAIFTAGCAMLCWWNTAVECVGQCIVVQCSVYCCAVQCCVVLCWASLMAQFDAAQCNAVHFKCHTTLCRAEMLHGTDCDKQYIVLSIGCIVCFPAVTPTHTRLTLTTVC